MKFTRKSSCTASGQASMQLEVLTPHMDAQGRVLETEYLQNNLLLVLHSKLWQSAVFERFLKSHISLKQQPISLYTCILYNLFLPCFEFIRLWFPFSPAAVNSTLQADSKLSGWGRNTCFRFLNLLPDSLITCFVKKIHKSLS